MLSAIRTWRARARREVINGNDLCGDYLHRWELWRTRSGWRVYLHRFLASDWSADMHDHPWWCMSIGLWGRYFEQGARGDC